MDGGILKPLRSPKCNDIVRIQLIWGGARVRPSRVMENQIGLGFEGLNN